jgi:hypothetical protein
MPNSAATRLLAELDPLDYPARMRLLAARTRRLAETGEIDEVLDALVAGDEFHRQLALTMAKISRRTDRLIAALHDPLYRLRAQALIACVARPGAQTDAAVLATLHDAPLAWRRDLARAVSAAGREEFADLLVGEHRDRLGETDTARLLPTCSAEVAARLLPGLAHLVPNWSRLGRRHPALVLAFARERLAAMPPGSREGWWWAYGDGLIAAAEHAPAQVLDLLEDFPLRHALPYNVARHIQILIRADEVRTLRLLAAPDGAAAARWRWLTHNTRRRLAAAGGPELEAIGRAVRDDPAVLARMLRDLRPGLRSAFYDAVTADQETQTALLAPEVLDALPHRRRHAQARRILALGALTDRPERRLVYTARLPWAQALPDLRAAARRAEPEERAAAYPLLIGCATADVSPAVVTELLTTELVRLRNEQDPVRRAALTALAAVPPDLFEDTETVADALGRLVTDALEARDVSAATHDALRRLACRILAVRTEDAARAGALVPWSLDALERLAGLNGRLPLGRLDRSLRRGQEFAVHRAMAPWIERGIERADHGLALVLAEALGRRAWAIPALQESVAHAVWHGTSATSRRAIELWLEDPAHRDERVGTLVAWDPTVAVIGRVSHVLSARRTDLLDGYLAGGTPLTGRFVASGAIWAPALHPSRRWLPRQSAAYGGLMARIAADAGAKVHARVAAIRALGLLPGESQRKVLRYLEGPDVPLAEAALGALAWSDDPAAALPVLLGYADGDRARVAVYAATRAARFARPSAAAANLRAVALSPSAKVTSRKEVLRIAAELEVPGLVDLLAEVWRLPGQHRDVKAAAASRLAEQMDDPRVPALLREAVADDPVVAVTLLRRHPHSLSERHRAEYGELVAGACAAADPKVCAVAVSAAPGWYRWTDSVAAAVCAAVADLDRRGDRTASPAALPALLREGMPMEQYAAVLESLLDADAADVDQAVSDRDRPARRRLASITQTGLIDTWARPGERRQILVRTVEVLRGRTGYAGLAAQLAAAALDLADESETLTAQLLALADLADGRPDAASRAGERIAARLAGKEPWSSTAVLAAAEALARRADPAAGILAVRVLAASGPRLGWPGPFRLAVKSLRRHPDPAVAEAALDLDTRSD